MSHTTTIPHATRKSLYIGILEYAIADIIQSFKRPCTYDEVSQVCDEDLLLVKQIVEVLHALEYVTIAPRSGKLTVTSQWRQMTKPVKEDKDSNPLVNLMKLALISEDRVFQRVDYNWSGYEGRKADELSQKLKHSFLVKEGREATDSEIIDSFCLILDNLNDWYNETFSLLRLVTNYNEVISIVRMNLKGKKSKGKIVDSVIVINSAIDRM